MTVADTARANAIPLELKKDGLQQRQNGDWVVRFTVSAADMDERITRAAMGTRFQAAFVEIGDDELPIEKPEKQKRDWTELKPSAQAAIRCNEPVFWSYLREHLYYPVNTADEAAETVRKICGVNTRAAFNSNEKANDLWQNLDRDFGAWKMAEQVG